MRTNFRKLDQLTDIDRLNLTRAVARAYENYSRFELSSLRLLFNFPKKNNRKILTYFSFLEAPSELLGMAKLKNFPKPIA